jgi:hypothetical protein
MLAANDNVRPRTRAEWLEEAAGLGGAILYSAAFYASLAYLVWPR